MKKTCLSLLLALSASSLCNAVEKKDIVKVSTNDLAEETQVMGQNAGDEHIMFVWWMPFEFWEATMLQDETLTPEEREDILTTLKDYTLLAVVQGDLSALGTVKFYPRDEVEKNMKITYKKDGSESTPIFLERNVSPELNVLINVFKPIMAGMMGNMGSNMHFFVLKNKDKEGNLIINPYNKGMLNFELVKKKEKTVVKDEIPMPLNSLFVPRKCPNGRDAHVSWKFCPWTGKELPE